MFMKLKVSVGMKTYTGAAVTASSDSPGLFLKLLFI